MFAGTEFLKSVIMSLLEQKMQFATGHVMQSNVDAAYLIYISRVQFSHIPQSVIECSGDISTQL